MAIFVNIDLPQILHLSEFRLSTFESWWSVLWVSALLQKMFAFVVVVVVILVVNDVVAICVIRIFVLIWIRIIVIFWIILGKKFLELWHIFFFVYIFCDVFTKKIVECSNSNSHICAYWLLKAGSRFALLTVEILCTTWPMNVSNSDFAKVIYFKFSTIVNYILK